MNLDIPCTCISKSPTGHNEIEVMPTSLRSPALLPHVGINPTPGQPYSSAGLTLAPPSIWERQHGLLRILDRDQSKPNEKEREARSYSMDKEPKEEEDAGIPTRKKRYHRHSVRQIQYMEAFFTECPHPDEKQRQDLGKALGLAPRQVKFWFQNRRTQLKAQQERQENLQLRAENERLRAENVIMREAIRHASCPACGGPAAAQGEFSFDEHELRIDNMRLTEELEKVSSIAARYFGKSAPSVVTLPRSVSLTTSRLGRGMNVRDIFSASSEIDTRLLPGRISELEKRHMLELAVTALDELHTMVRSSEPLWVKSADGASDILNYDAYLNQFPEGISSRILGWKTEATRETGLLIMNGTTLVDAFMDANKWKEMFPTIISNAVTLEILSPGARSTRDGALQLMHAELHVLSPLVQTRENYFLRYCKQLVDTASWILVDVSIDSVRGNPPMSTLKWKRHPSGCLIMDLLNGYSQVTWVEHVESDDREVNKIFRSLVNSGMAFGAKRWVATLQRYCESMACLLATNVQAGEFGVIQSLEGRRGMLRLAQRMSESFCASINSSSNNTWFKLPNTEEDDLCVMSRRNPGEGILLSIATSVWLPFPHQRVFDFLRNQKSRGEWDALANGTIQEMCHVAKGKNPGNNVSLFQIDASNPKQSTVLFIQESCIDASGSFLVYAPIDISALNLVLQGKDPSTVLVIPSGFVILPDEPEIRSPGFLFSESIGMDHNSPISGSILTIFLQIAVSHMPSLGILNAESVNNISTHMINTVQHIKAGLEHGHS